MNEIKKYFDKVDMMITMHSVLRDRYNRISKFIKIVLLIASVFLNATLFMDFEQYASFVTEDTAKMILSALSLLVFTISVILLVINLNGKGESHSFACKQLSAVKDKLRECLNNGDSENSVAIQNSCKSEYENVFKIIVPIPERLFNRLKAKHHLKVEISKFISKNKGLPYLIIHLKYYYLKLFTKKLNEA